MFKQIAYDSCLLAVYFLKKVLKTNTNI